MIIIKKTKSKYWWEEKIGRNLYILLVIVETVCSSGNQYGKSVLMIKLYHPLIYAESKQTEHLAGIRVCTSMSIIVLFPIANKWMPISRWIDRENVTYIQSRVVFSHNEDWNYVTCKKRDGTRQIMLSKASQIQKHKHCFFFLTSGI